MVSVTKIVTLLAVTLLACSCSASVSNGFVGLGWLPPNPDGTCPAGNYASSNQINGGITLDGGGNWTRADLGGIQFTNNKACLYASYQGFDDGSGGGFNPSDAAPFLLVNNPPVKQNTAITITCTVAAGCSGTVTAQ